jgi:hypothetical protein
VNRKGNPVNGFQQANIFVRAVRQIPRRHLDAERRTFWTNLVDQLTAVFDGSIKELLRYIPRIRTIPKLRAK